MARKILLLLAAMLFSILIFSCQKLPESSVGYSFAMEELPIGDTIPLDWGVLISVSSAHLQYPGWVQLWFQDKEGNVYMVPYDVEVKKFGKFYRYLKRK